MPDYSVVLPGCLHEQTLTTAGCCTGSSSRYRQQQGVVTLIGPVEPFATEIKIESNDQHVILC